MNNFHSAFFIVIFFTVILSKSSSAQFKQEIDTNNFLSEKSVLQQRSLNNSNYTEEDFKMKKQPWRAVAYSALLPGAGQFYTESYWKIPIILGAGGYFVYGIINNNNQYIDYRDQYLNSQTAENPSGDPRLLNLREFYRDQRDNFIIYSSILYLANLIDAYIDAELYDFNVSDKIKFGLLKKNNLIGIDINF
ncbi:MAG TPA: hypothetical protein DCY06_02580 [Bacteroidetes bacterium]|nr:hypothetical protein [Bacteroidota bacterium]